MDNFKIQWQEHKTIVFNFTIKLSWKGKSCTIMLDMLYLRYEAEIL